MQQPYANELLNEREATHGDYQMNSYLAQELKRCIRDTLKLRGFALASDQHESLDMICSKIGRIVSGNPDEPEHWRDIAGYADLVKERLTR